MTKGDTFHELPRTANRSAKPRARQRTGLFKIFSQKGLRGRGRVPRITPLSRQRKHGAEEEGERCDWVSGSGPGHTKRNPSRSQRSSSESC
ncbi:hypothetical protein BLAT2472_160001 [Burkholderia latens]